MMMKKKNEHHSGEHERLGASGRCPRRTSGTAGRRARTAPSSRRCRTAARASGGRCAGAGARAGSGRPPVRRLARSVRRMSMRLAVARLLVAARAPQRRCELEPRHQPVELRELVRLERVEALLPQQLLVARRRQRHLDLGRPRRPRRARRAATTSRSRPRSCSPARGGVVLCSAAGPLVRRRRGRARVLGLELVLRPAVRRTPRRTRCRRPRAAPGRTRTRRAPSSTAAGA